MKATSLDFSIDRDDLCDRMGGGLAPGSLCVIEGAHGAGKSILTQRISYGLVQHDHSVSIVSTELTTSGFLAQAASLKYDVDEALRAENLVFIPAYPMVGTSVPRSEMLRRIALARRLYTKDVVVIDSFSKFLADHMRAATNPQEAMEDIENALYLFKRLTSRGKTIILNFEKGQVSDEIVAIFKEAADALLSLQYELVGNAASRRIVVQRLSRAPGRFGDIIGYRVEPGLGIVIEIKSVV